MSDDNHTIVLAQHRRMSVCCTPPTLSLLCMQGIVAMLPYMSKQVANISRDDLVIFLKEGNPLFTSLSLPTASKFGELG